MTGSDKTDIYVDIIYFIISCYQLWMAWGGWSGIPSFLCIRPFLLPHSKEPFELFVTLEMWRLIEVVVDPIGEFLVFSSQVEAKCLCDILKVVLVLPCH